MDFSTVMLMTGQAGQGGSGGSPLGMLMPFMLIFLIFYFLIIRPQNNERKKHQELLDALKSGDRVITAGGILGTIHSVTDETVQLKIGEKTKITVLRSSVRGLQGTDTSKLND